MKTALMESTGATVPHLDDEAFADLLLAQGILLREGETGSAAQAHLGTCAQCREELARFRDAVADFSVASRAWGEVRSQALPATLRPQRPALAAAPFASLSAPTAWALAALLLLGVGLPLKLHFEHRQAIEGTAQASAGSPGSGNALTGRPRSDEEESDLNSPEQIALDNELLAAVNVELSRSQAALLAHYARRNAAGRGDSKP